MEKEGTPGSNINSRTRKRFWTQKEQGAHGGGVCEMIQCFKQMPAWQDSFFFTGCLSHPSRTFTQLHLTSRAESVSMCVESDIPMAIEGSNWPLGTRQRNKHATKSSFWAGLSVVEHTSRRVGEEDGGSKQACTIWQNSTPSQGYSKPYAVSYTKKSQRHKL